MDKDIEQKDFEFRFPEIELRSPESSLRFIEINLQLAEKKAELEKHTSSLVASTEKDYQLRLLEKKAELEKRNLTYADLLNFAAMLILGEEVGDLESQAKDSHLEAQDLIIEFLTLCVEDQKRIIETVKTLDGYSKKFRSAAEELEVEMEKYQRKKKAIKAADALHDLPGGSREKQENIRKIWASGKYTSRSICAEQECAALGMSYDSARKALRNMPAPT